MLQISFLVLLNELLNIPMHGSVAFAAIIRIGLPYRGSFQWGLEGISCIGIHVRQLQVTGSGNRSVIIGKLPWLVCFRLEVTMHVVAAS